MPASTSTQRTYRYVRLGILGAILAIGVSVIAVIAGEGPLSSISAVHYTPGSAVFTGSLFAMALAFLVLAGHSPSQSLLDLAALAAPLIAILPTPIRSGDIPGVTVDCDVPCVPAGELPAIGNGLVTFLVVAVVVIVAALVLARVQGTIGAGVIATAAIAALVTIGGVVWWLLDRDGFVQNGHVLAASAFLGLIAAVAGLAARRSVRPYRAVYLVVAVGIAVGLGALVTVVLLRFVQIDLARDTGLPLVFLGESVALVLFATFWTAQTVQFWNELDPSLRVV